ncbi:MAG: ABC transporter permease subunit, partial [Gammaproteobacteria bacterium]|nr:ABC transporter permease subunit [Gammaproteobacteria bacterium]
MSTKTIQLTTLSISRLNSPGTLAAVIVILAILPLLHVVTYGLNLSIDEWKSLWSHRIPELFLNTLTLALVVSIFSLIMGISTAWIVARKAFIGRKAAIWLLLLPLTIPTYVFAHIYTSLLDDNGWLGGLWHLIFGESSPVPDLSNVFGVAFVLALAGFSYIFLLVRTALSHSTKSLEEAAQIQGARGREIFFKVNLPLMRPAIAAGLAVIVLHVLSDFGAVSMLRYQTFTLSIYNQMSGRMDYNAAAGLSFILIILSLSFLVLERFFRKRQRFFSGAQTKKVQRQQATRNQQFLIWGWLGLITIFSFLLPLAWMIHWSFNAWQQELIDFEFWEYCINSGIIAFASATIALVLAFPIAFYHTRKHTLLSQSYLQLSSVGFALPGPVIALGV